MTETRDIVDDLVAEIDRRLSLAHASLLLARAGCVRGPGAAAERACQAAETQLDDLLDQRLALSPIHRPPAWCGADVDRPVRIHPFDADPRSG